MRKCLVSLVALGLFLGAPALADTAKSTSTQGTSTQATTSQASTLNSEQTQGLLSGYEQRSEIIGGQLAWGSTSEGEDLLIFGMPPAGGSAGTQDSDIADRLQGAGFSQIETLDDPRIARAELDSDHYIFALSAAEMSKTGSKSGSLTDETDSTGQSGTAMGQTDTQSGTTMSQSDTQSDTQSGTSGQSSGSTMSQSDTSGTQSGTQSGTTMSQSGSESTTQMDSDSASGQTSRALSEPGADRIVGDLEEAGLEDAKEFKGRLVKAMGDDGSPVFFIITAKDMTSDAEVTVSEDDVRKKLEESNLKDIEFVVDARIVRGSLGDEQVFVLAGDLLGEGGQQ